MPPATANTSGRAPRRGNSDIGCGIVRVMASYMADDLHPLP